MTKKENLLETVKIKFLKGQAIDGAISSAVRECSNVYQAKENDRNEARKFWKEQLSALGESYIANQEKRPYSEVVISLQKMINDNYADVFTGSGIRIAQCHKSLSVYLKWLWCLGIMKTVPPSCPFDREILTKAIKVLKESTERGKTEYQELVKVLNDNIAWSSLDSLNDYKKILRALDKVGELQESRAAEWELKEWNKNLLNNM